jgi:hypothetical protein
MKWVTRERPKIDRIACPWLITHFIDKTSEFLYVAPAEVLKTHGLFAISLGLSHVYADDHEMLKHGMVMYDALYAWCRHLVGETHAWPPKMD